jgi:uncharacterized protein (UPF0276 family)
MPIMRVASTIPARSGVGLKPEHYRGILDGTPDLGFLEIHAENYMGAGGPPHFYLERIRERYPLSVHGVGLSIGAASPLDMDHLSRLRLLCDRYEPGRFSEHLAWSSHTGTFLNDLLPAPYTDETLGLVCEHIEQVQEALGRRMLLENPSTYLAYSETEMAEVHFLAEVVRRTGCGLLLDVNNVAVSAANIGFDPFAYVDAFPVEHVGEYHLAGYLRVKDGAEPILLIDAHGSPVEEDVWELYLHALGRTGPVPTLIEWDNDVPALDVLLEEARLAEELMLGWSGQRVA